MGDDEDFQLSMMRRLRQVNVDHQHVGWYQSSQFGNFLSPQLLESQFSYQTSIDESVCLIFDTAKTAQGFLSLKAHRMTRDPLPEEDLSKLFKNVPAPSRLNPLILSGTINFTADEVSEFCSQSLAKLFLTEPLQNSKIEMGQGT